MTKTAKIKINEKVIDCKIVAVYPDHTVRIEYPTYDYMGRYNGYICETVTQDKIIREV